MYLFLSIGQLLIKMAEKGYWIEQFSDEYNVIQCSIAKCVPNKLYINSLAVWKIDNPLLRTKFEANSEGSQIQSWLNTKDVFHGTNTDIILSQIHGGFAFPSGGMKFSADFIDGIAIEYDVNGNIISLDETQNYGLILCDVSIGHPYVLDGENIEEKVSGDIPEGYDSFVVPIPTHGANVAMSGPNQWYYLKNPIKVCPVYFVQVTFSNDRNKSLYHCAIGEIPPKAPSSKLLNMQAQVSDMRAYEYYDYIGGKLVTAKDKLRMEHDDSTIGKHHIIGLNEALAQVLKESQSESQAEDAMPKAVMDKGLIAKRERLETLLDNIDEKMRSVNLNYANAFERINELAELAKKRLSEHTALKLSVLKSVDAEVTRKIEEIDRFESHFLRERALASSVKESTSVAASAMQFLHTWKVYNNQKNDLLNSREVEFGQISQFNPNIVVNSSITIDDEVDPLEGLKNKIGDTGESILEKILMVEPQGAVYDVNGSEDPVTLYSNPVLYSDATVCKEKQSIFDSQMLKIHEAVEGIKRKGGMGWENDGTYFPIPPSIAATYGVDCWSRNQSCSSSVSLVGDPFSLYDASIRSTLNSNPSKADSVRAKPESRDVAARQSFNSTTSTLPPPPPPAGAPPPLPLQPPVTNKSQSTPGLANEKKGKVGENEKIKAMSKPTTRRPSSMALSMGIDNIKETVSKFGPQFSLSIASERKMKQLGKAISLHDVPNCAFPNSSILQNPQDASSLYFSMPFFGGKLPQTKLIYTTELHVKSFAELFSRVSVQVRLIFVDVFYCEFCGLNALISVHRMERVLRLF